MDRKKHTDSWLEQTGAHYEEPDDFQEMEDDKKTNQEIFSVLLPFQEKVLSL